MYEDQSSLIWFYISDLLRYNLSTKVTNKHGSRASNSLGISTLKHRKVQVTKYIDTNVFITFVVELLTGHVVSRSWLLLALRVNICALESAFQASP